MTNPFENILGKVKYRHLSHLPFYNGLHRHTEPGMSSLQEASSQGTLLTSQRRLIDDTSGEMQTNPACSVMNNNQSVRNVPSLASLAEDGGRNGILSFGTRVSNFPESTKPLNEAVARCRALRHRLLPGKKRISSKCNWALRQFLLLHS